MAQSLSACMLDSILKVCSFFCSFHPATRHLLPSACLFLPVSLSDSEFIDDLDHIICHFDTTRKTHFWNPDDLQYIKFGSTRDNDSNHNIRFGQLKIAGNKVAEFFTPSVRCIVNV